MKRPYVDVERRGGGKGFVLEQLLIENPIPLSVGRIKGHPFFTPSYIEGCWVGLKKRNRGWIKGRSVRVHVGHVLRPLE